MTNREAEVFAFLVTFFLSNGYAPSVREIGKALYITNNTIHRHLMNLSKKGYVKHVPNMARGFIPMKGREAV